MKLTALAVVILALGIVLGLALRSTVTQAEAAGETAGGLEAEEAGGERGDPAGGVHVAAAGSRGAEGGYLIPTTIESGPTRGWTWVSWNPASRIQEQQSAPV